MKEKIYKYLLQEQEKITSEKILEKFFYTFNETNPQAEKIVNSILSDDARFLKDESGVWSVKKHEEKQQLNNIVFSIIEFASISVGNKKELPVLVAIAHVQNFKTISKKIYTLDVPLKISNEIQKSRKALISEIEVDGKFFDNLNSIYKRLTNSILITANH